MNQNVPTDELAVIALGSNLPGGSNTVQGVLEAAVLALSEAGFEIVRRSRWWRSAAWPNASDPPFLNGVAIAAWRGGAAQALAALHGVEARFGRARGALNAPRVLDLDLIDLGSRISDAPGLILPHPRAAERYFVMAPLAEIAPDWRHPVSGLSALDLAASASIGRDAVPQ